MFLSCRQKQVTGKLFDIDSVVTEQVYALSDLQAKLHKQAVIGSVTGDTLYTPPDTTSWNLELNIFRQLQMINKPVNRGRYLVDDGLFDPHSNLTVKAISAKADLPVRYIRIFYQESIAKPRKIEASYRDENSLSKAGRLLSMEFQQVNNRSILTAYSIEGGQKMIFGDTVTFDVRGKIVFR